MRSLFAGLAAITILVPTIASAQEDHRLEVTVPIEIQFDGVYDSADRDAELADTYTTIEPAISLRLGHGLSLEAGLTYEPINDPTNDRFFSDQGLYVKDLYLRYARGLATLTAGKYAPPFGVAWDLTPGIYGSDFAEDYELTERIGLGASFDFTGPGGTAQTFSVNTFYQDHSGLSRSWFQRRAQTREGDGGASNTGDLSSFSTILTGEAPGPLAGVNYQISYDHLAAGQGNPEDENAVAVAIFGDVPVWEDWTLTHVVEIAFFQNAKAAEEDRTYATLGLGLINGPWAFEGSYSTRSIDPEAGGQANTDDELFQFSVGRDIYRGFNLSLGYRYVEDANVDSHTVGLLLTHEFSFGAF